MADEYRKYATQNSEMMPSKNYPGRYATLNKMLDDHYYLTKVRREMWPKEMTDDLVFTQAPDDKEEKLVIYEEGYVGKWISSIIFIIFIWLIISGIMFLPRWLWNKAVEESSALYITKKRCFTYPLSFFGFLLFLYLMPSSIQRGLENIFEFMGEILEFIMHLINFLGIPEIINLMIIFLLVIFFIFMAIHLFYSGIVRLVEKYL